jgi:hypothetical protein
MSIYSAGLIGAALARILDQAGLAAYGRLKYRNALIHGDEGTPEFERDTEPGVLRAEHGLPRCDRRPYGVGRDLKWFEPKTIYPLIAVRDREER